MAANPHRTKQIRRAALEALKPAHPYALPEDTLFNYLDDLVRPPLSAAERSAVLDWLREGKYAIPTAGSLDPDTAEWVITELGKSLLASL
jgi:hypothetical protein